MTNHIFWFLAVVFFMAVFVREDFIFVLLYIFAGALVLGRWWGKRALSKLEIKREFVQRVFLGEKIKVRLQITNLSWMPLAWLQVRETLPIEVYSSGPFQRVVTLGPKASLTLEYELDCRRRGYYAIGPLDLYSGDILGVVAAQKRNEAPEYLTVYPKIVALRNVRVPSFAPLGTLRHNQPIFEDPSRILGKRDYVAGDSLRRVDWKATATSGRLQVKLLEPSIALETAIFLNLNVNEYDLYARFGASEQAIVIAASLASWVVSVRQSVGLVTNGIDPFLDGQMPLPVPPRRGRGHLLRLLETLARVQIAESLPLVDLLNRESSRLTWGTTLIVITNSIDEALFDGLFQARRSGLNAFLIQCGSAPNFNEIRRRAHYFGFPIHQVIDERDMNIWRQ